MILIASEYKHDFTIIKNEYSTFTKNLEKDIKKNQYLDKILHLLKINGYTNFIFTHKGNSCHKMLKENKISNYFVEVIISKNGFKRKPNPEALLYLVEKYNLDINKTYYIGDREIDVFCANNAGIKSILVYNELNKKKATYSIKNLIDLKTILNLKEEV